VALKVIKAGMDTKQVVARFEAERQALAMMDHPNVAKVFDAGVTENGRPYFVMEVVQGEPVTDYCDRHRLTIDQRLDLFVSICQAIQHAHHKGIIHRDIKPSNVLVTIRDDHPVPKIIDFGVAKATAQPLTGRTLFTEQGQLIGTPAYMSPEQAEMTGLDIDTRSDIYSLGVMLYELLTGARPFGDDALKVAGFAGLARIIREQEPPKPSTKISTLGDESGVTAKSRRLNPDGLRRRLRGDLDWIVMKALEKERTRRYATALDFAEDVERYTKHEPVEAGPPGPIYRLRKFARKYAVALSAAATIALILVVGVAASTFFAIESHRNAVQARMTLRDLAREKAKTEAERDRAIALERDARNQTQIAKQAQEQAEANARAANAAREREQANLYVGLMSLAQLEWLDGDVSQAEQHLEKCPMEFRHWEWKYLQRLCHSDLLSLSRAARTCGSVAFSPDGKHLASGWSDGTLTMWNIAKQTNVLEIRGHEDHVWSVEFSPDGTRLASASSDTTVKIWDCATGRESLALRGHRQAVRAVAFSPNGRQIVSAAGIDSIKIWDLSTGQESASIPRSFAGIFGVACSPDGRAIAFGRGDGVVTVWDPAKSEKICEFSGHDGPVWDVAFSPVESLLCSAGEDTTVRIWDVEAGHELRTLRGHSGAIRSVSFSLDGNRIATGSEDRTVKIWDAGNGQVLLTLRGQGITVLDVAFSPDGRLLASAGEDLKIFDTMEDPEARTLSSRASAVRRIHTLVFSPDGKRIAFAGTTHTGIGGVLKMWHVTTGGRPVTLAEQSHAVTSVAFIPNGHRIVSAGKDGTVRTWDVTTGSELDCVAMNGGSISSTALSPDGKRIAAAGNDGRLKICEVATGRELSALSGATAPTARLAFSPDGRRLASANKDSVAVWDLVAGKTLSSPPRPFEHIGMVSWIPDWLQVAFSPDGKRIASAGCSVAKIWDADTGEELRVFNFPFFSKPASAAFSPDGKRLAFGCSDRTVRMYDVATGQRVFSLHGHSAAVTAVLFSPDGSQIASADEDGVVKIWNTKARRGRVRDVVIPEPRKKPAHVHAKALPALPFDKWVDALDETDVVKDRVAGEWQRQGNEVTISLGTEYSVLVLPVTVSTTYDLEVEFTRNEGDKLVFVVLPVGGKQCMLMLDGGSGTRRASGLAQIDGRREWDNPTAVHGQRLENGRRYSALIRIGTMGDTATIEVSLDRQPLLQWTGRTAALSLFPALRVPDPRKPGLGAWNSAVTFHAARFRCAEGTASWDKRIGSEPIHVPDENGSTAGTHAREASDP